MSNQAVRAVRQLQTIIHSSAQPPTSNLSSPAAPNKEWNGLLKESWLIRFFLLFYPLRGSLVALASFCSIARGGLQDLQRISLTDSKLESAMCISLKSWRSLFRSSQPMTRKDSGFTSTISHQPSTSHDPYHDTTNTSRLQIVSYLNN